MMRDVPLKDRLPNKPTWWRRLVSGARGRRAINDQPFGAPANDTEADRRSN